MKEGEDDSRTGDLFREDQFALAGPAQPVDLAQVFDPDLVAAA